MPSSYLIRRNGVYHFRISVPLDLRNIIGCREFHRSLKTRQAGEARHLAATLKGNALALFSRARHLAYLGLPPQEVSKSLDRSLKVPADGPIYSLPSTHGATQVLVAPYPHQASPTLFSSINEFLGEKKLSWTPKTTHMHTTTLDLFKRHIGNQPLATITKAECRHFRDLLAKSPAHFTQRHKGMSLEKASQLGGAPMSVTTVNRQIGIVSSFFSWAFDQDIIDRNPASKLRIKLNHRPDSERLPFSKMELRLLFEDTPLYRKPFSHRDLEEEAATTTAPQFWIPLVGLHTGMRLEEICQLTTRDIVEVEQVHVISVNGLDGKKLKNRSSERLVPISETLLQLGFLDYALSLLQHGTERLWPGLIKDRHNYYSAQFSKWFGRYKRACGVANSKATFHSFRHNFINHLKQDDTDEAKIKELVGHSDSSITMARYGKRYNTRRLKETIDKIDYGLDLNRLFPSAR